VPGFAADAERHRRDAPRHCPLRRRPDRRRRHLRGILAGRRPGVPHLVRALPLDRRHHPGHRDDRPRARALAKEQGQYRTGAARGTEPLAAGMRREREPDLVGQGRDRKSMARTQHRVHSATRRIKSTRHQKSLPRRTTIDIVEAQHHSENPRENLSRRHYEVNLANLLSRISKQARLRRARIGLRQLQ
jgi:hypothetical protein